MTSFPIFHRRKDGEMIEGDLSASLIYDEKGNEAASVGIFKDLRERLKMERELREIQQALLQSEKLAAMGRLTSQIAHELNNPIYGIMNTLELLKTEIPPASKRRRILELSLSEIQRLSEMLRNMLSFSKPEEEARKRIYQNPDKYVHHIYGENEVGGTSWLYITDVPFERLGFRTDLSTTSAPELSRTALAAVPFVLTLWPPLLMGLYTFSRRREEAVRAEAGESESNHAHE